MSIKVLLLSQEKVHAAVNGATKMLYYFANGLADRGYEVVVAYPTDENPTADPNLNPKVAFYNLNYIDMSKYKSKRRRYSLKELIMLKLCKNALEKIKVHDIGNRMEYVVDREKPDVIIPFFAHVTAQLVFGKRYEIPIIQMYHTHPKVYHAKVSTLEKKPKDMAILFNHCVKKITALQLFFPSYAEYMKPYYSGKICIIHNPVKIPQEKVDLKTTKKKLIYLSRIDKNKGQNSLIEAFSMIAHSYQDWEVELWGDFEPQKYLRDIENLIAKYDLGRQVRIKGVTNNPTEVFMNADIGVYPSNFEGFPLGLSEALAIGLPCIGFETATGINELIKDRENGLLCEYSIIDLARKLTELMNNQPLRIKYGDNARKSVEQYSEAAFWAKWENFICDVLYSGKKK